MDSRVTALEQEIEDLAAKLEPQTSCQGDFSPVLGPSVSIGAGIQLAASRSATVLILGVLSCKLNESGSSEKFESSIADSHRALFANLDPNLSKSDLDFRAERDGSTYPSSPCCETGS